MGAYILRRLLLIIPTLIGIMVVNFTLTQFVPGGPIEQIAAQVRGEGDVLGNLAGATADSAQTPGGINPDGTSGMSGALTNDSQPGGGTP